MKKYFLLAGAAVALSVLAASCGPRRQDSDPSAEQDKSGAFYSYDLTSGVLVNTDGAVCRIRWKGREDAKKYILYRARGNYGTYERVEEFSPDRTDCQTSEHIYDSYKVTALVGDEEIEIGRGSTFSDNTLVVSPEDDMAAVQSAIDDVHASLETAATGQFSSERAACLFLPGRYDLTAKVGYYTSVNGLGEVPTDVSLGSVYVSGSVLSNLNATCTFWRSVENVSVRSSVTWAVSQATSFRRARVDGSMSLSYGGYASGGFLANTVVTGSVHGSSQQQWMTRNTEAQGFDGGSFNMVYAGCQGQIAAQTWTETGGTNTILASTERIAEKPFLYCSGDEYRVFVPLLQEDAVGVTWKDGLAAESGMSVPLREFYIADARYDTAVTLNSALKKGKHLLFTPGIYVLDAPLEVELDETVLLGIGYATLKIGDTNGDAAIKVGDVRGVRIADLLVDAGIKSENMVVIGTGTDESNHSSDPTVLSNLYLRIGGVENAHTETDTALVIHANDVIGDNFWVWRADHSNGVEWRDERTDGVTKFGNPARTGVLVTGDRVTCYALMVEHFEDYQTVWKGEDGHVVMYQSETPYRVPEQSLWMSHDGTKPGCASYKVDDTVMRHRGVGIGVYLVNYSGMTLGSAIEVPERDGIVMEHLVTCRFSNGTASITHVINDYGGSVGANSFSARVPRYPL